MKKDIENVLVQVFQRLKNDGAFTTAPVLEQFMDDIKFIASGVEKTLGDGFQWRDFLALSQLVKPLIVIVEEVDALTSEQKRRFVAEAVWLVYKTYDGGVDGTQNNINVPFVFGAFERKLEETLVPMIVEFAVQAVYDELKTRGELG